MRQRVLLLALLVPVVLLVSSLAGEAADPCDAIDTFVLSDPAGDATPGSPLYVDILVVNIRHLANRVQIEWVTADSSFGGQDVLLADEQFFTVDFDLDRDDSTGDGRGIPGVDFEISVSGHYPGEAELSYFDEQGNWLGDDLVWVPVVFTNEGFMVEIDVDAHLFGSRHFDVVAHTSGVKGWQDSGAPEEVALDESGTSVEVRLRAEQMVLEARPPLAAIPTATSDLQLLSVLLHDGSPVPVDPSRVSYEVSHSRPDFVPDPSSIISVTPGGLAQYESDGFVLVTSQVECGPFDLESEPIILATGAVYGDPRNDPVIAVFRSDFVPATSVYSFGDMMSGFPDAMKLINTAYDVSSDLYSGYRPLGSATQILAPIVADGLCGGPGNPMQTAPCCYMNCGSGAPQYEVIIHEMGHNFQQLGGMAQLLFDNDGAICASGFCECSASLPVIYLQHEIVENGPAYGFDPGSFEYDSFQEARAHYCPTSQTTLEEFEQQIDAGTISGIFDPGVEEGVGVHCAFFEQFTCGYVEGANPYRHESVRRFLQVLGDRQLPGFVADKAETYFGAVYSLAVGRDMRARLRFWGFDIDDGYYEEILPMVELRLEQAERRISHDSFESGDTAQWVVFGGRDVEILRSQPPSTGTHVLAFRIEPCTVLQDLDLSHHTVVGSDVFQACNSISAGDKFVVASSGNATFSTGSLIRLRNEFTVQAGGDFTAELDTSLSPFAYLEDESATRESVYNAEFRVSFDDLTMAPGDELGHLLAYGTEGPELRLLIRPGPTASLEVRDNSGSWFSTTPTPLAAGWNRIVVSWEGRTNATCSVKVNDNSPLLLEGLDTTGRTIESVRWGAVEGTITATSGQILVDEFFSWR